MHAIAIYLEIMASEIKVIIKIKKNNSPCLRANHVDVKSPGVPPEVGLTRRAITPQLPGEGGGVDAAGIDWCLIPDIYGGRHQNQLEICARLQQTT